MRLDAGALMSFATPLPTGTLSVFKQKGRLWTIQATFPWLNFVRQSLAILGFRDEFRAYLGRDCYTPSLARQAAP